MDRLSKLSEQYHVHTPTCLWYREQIGTHSEKMKTDPTIKCDCWCHKE